MAVNVYPPMTSAVSGGGGERMGITKKKADDSTSLTMTRGQRNLEKLEILWTSFTGGPYAYDMYFYAPVDKVGCRVLW